MTSDSLTTSNENFGSVINPGESFWARKNGTIFFKICEIKSVVTPV